MVMLSRASLKGITVMLMRGRSQNQAKSPGTRVGREMPGHAGGPGDQGLERAVLFLTVYSKVP